MRKFLILITAGASLCATSFAQSSQQADQSGADAQPSESQPAQQPSLGDYARQLRLKKQQKEAQLQQAKAKLEQPSEPQTADATPKAQPKTAHLVTKDETPERATVTQASVREAQPKEDAQPSASDHAAQGEEWKSKILAQKQAIAALEQDVKSVGDSIHFAGGNCVANCAEWNEHQQQKQQEVETMKGQLEEQKKALEDLQDQARKAGFGGAVTDPQPEN